MERKVSRTITANETPLTPTMKVKRVFPSQSFKNIDPFVFLDHFGPTVFKPGETMFAEGTGAHPHRGFITFTYIFDGDMEHKDSRGHHGWVSAGGAQWMKAASGIIHDEKPSQQFVEKGGLLNGLQLWINLPRAQKSDTPQYQNLPSEAVHEVTMGANNSLLRVLIGEYQGNLSSIPTYSPMFIYHIRLAGHDTIRLSIPESYNAFAYIPTEKAELGNENKLIEAGQMGIFEQGNTDILLTNPNENIQDIMLFGGEPIREPIIAYGPFVMDTIDGVQTAYDDFYAGKYGEITI
jgi:redox-sensitive bicupin YhaK (pirin superfamily)